MSCQCMGALIPDGNDLSSNAKIPSDTPRLKKEGLFGIYTLWGNNNRMATAINNNR